MKKLLFLIAVFFFVNSIFATEYHFQQGFATSTPDGWIRQCNSTSTLNHTGLAFSGTYAAKFDVTGSGRYGKNLITPQVAGADTLSFYVSKNANATYMTLYVGKVVGADTTILQSYDAYNFPNKSATPGFSQIILPVKLEDNMKIIFYAVESTDPTKVNDGWFIVDDIELSKYSGTVTTPDNSVEKISTNFGDGTWGTIATTTYTSGSYPSSTINGFNLTKAFLYSGSVTCETGEVHTNRILLDKSSQGAAVEFPVLKTVGEVEIHATTGTEGMSFRLEEWTNNAWTSLGTYITRKSPDSIYVIPVLRNAETQLRIANNTGSGLYIYKIVTRTYQEATELTLRSSSPTEGEVCFANLKKEITLTFNKNVVKNSGTILLNGVDIPLSSCIITDNIVSIPVTLENIQGSNKNYTFTVSAGTFAESGNLDNLSKAISVGFQTLKAVVYPSNYNALLDVVYKNVNSTNTRMDVYYPSDASTKVPVVINMHGGGWSGGYKEEQGGFNMYFNRNYAVVNVEYRLRGEALAPACVEDVRGALHYVLNHANEWNIDVNKVIFQGGSAGGHLALMGGYLQNNRIYDNDCTQYTDPIKIMAVVDKYGPCDFTQLMSYSSLIAWTGENFSNTEFVNSLAPITYVNANTPPTYIIHGDADPTIPYNQSVTLYAALQNAGVKSKFTTVPGGGHGGFPTEYNTQMETEILQFLDEVLALSTSVKNVQNVDFPITVNNQSVSINTTDNIVVSVYNSLGKEILKTSEKQFSIRNSGLFIIKIDVNNTTYCSKIVIK